MKSAPYAGLGPWTPDLDRRAGNYADLRTKETATIHPTRVVNDPTPQIALLGKVHYPDRRHEQGYLTQTCQDSSSPSQAYQHREPLSLCRRLPKGGSQTTGAQANTTPA